MRTAVVLFNLGGPDTLEAVRPFLFNLFRDPAIIRLPCPLRQLVAWMIARKRAPEARKIYAFLGGRSPILPNTKDQATALEAVLNTESDPSYRCFIAMRYWHPVSDETAAEIFRYAPDRIVYLPLYPQYSTTTTASSFRAMDAALDKIGCKAKKIRVNDYPDDPGFISALVDGIRAVWDQAAAHGTPRLLLSAHGLPERIANSGDPYVDHCRRTAEAVIAALRDKHPDWILCFQSRVGPLAWVKPYLDEEIRRAGQDKKPIIVAPIAFVSEHSETLVELDIECRALALASGAPFYARAATVSIKPAFIEGLAKLIRDL